MRFFLTLILSLALISNAVAVEVAGELFVDLHAKTFNSGDTDWANSGTYTDFTAAGDPQRSAIGTTPMVVFNGSNYFAGKDEAPEGLTGVDPTRSIEVWALNPSIASEETLVSWGKRGGPDGTNMAFNYGNHALFGAVGHWGGNNPDMGWVDNPPNAVPGAPEALKWHHLVYTFDEETARVYSDGILQNEEDMVQFGGLNTHFETPIAIATQWEGNGIDATGPLKGTLAIGQVRIHDEVLSDTQILANFNEEKPTYIDPIIDPPPPPPPLKPEAIPTGPTIRYDFNIPAGDATDKVVPDVIGNLDANVLGDGARFTGTQLDLEGGGSDFAAYVDLPNGIISGLTNTTIETWVTIEGQQSWSRIFDFGSNSPGGDDGELEEPGDDNGGNTQGLDYLFLSASRGTNTDQQRLEIRNEDPGGGGITTIDSNDVQELGEEFHMVVTYEEEPTTPGLPQFGTVGRLTYYRDGEEVASGITNIKLADINDVNNWLGRSNWTNDANLEGSYEEFRLYDYALTANQILGNFEAGPNTVNIGNNCDFDGDGSLGAGDIDLLSAAIRSGEGDLSFDVNGDGSLDRDDLNEFITAESKLHTWIGDANLDGEFNSTDFVSVFQQGEYEDAVDGNSTWEEGDWNGDGDFGSSDFVAAFQDGGFELGPRWEEGVAAVPEPAGMALILLGILGSYIYRRRK